MGRAQVAVAHSMLVSAYWMLTTRRALPRPRSRLAQPTQQRSPHPTARRPARTPRAHRDPRPRRLTGFSPASAGTPPTLPQPALTQGIHGSVSVALFESLHWLMRMGGRPATSTHTGAGEPVEVYGAGVSVAAGLLLRARGSVSWQRSLRSDAVRRGSSHGGRGTPWRSCSTGSPVWMSARRR